MEKSESTRNDFIPRSTPYFVGMSYRMILNMTDGPLDAEGRERKGRDIHVHYQDL
jgi:hypothetical protein